MKYYYSLNDYFRQKYKTRVQKITLSLPFTCPHGRCSYCYDGSKPPYNDIFLPLKTQIENGISYGKKRYGNDTKFIAYFQSYSNTNKPFDELKKYYDEVLNYSEIVGISIGTRTDCIDDEKLMLIDSYIDKNIDVWIELGLQSANENTLNRINRGHTVLQFVEMFGKVKKTRIKTVIHIIIGLPGEDKHDFHKTAKLVSTLHPFGVKIHPLYIVDKTPLAMEYKERPFKLLNLEEYIDNLTDVIEILPPDIVIMRFTAEAPQDMLIAPEYCSIKYKNKINELLIKEFGRRESWQGSRK
ncbi:MAG: TIGR01212 family radical SAM protein [Candidatus Goldbacteria bacterium]|nr:TIGR01212 family radical SAM protein [Candidatus Goldiibacteriota bacterium]